MQHKKGYIAHFDDAVIKDFLKTKKISTQQIAKLCGMSHDSVGAALRHTYALSPKIVKVLDDLGLPREKYETEINEEKQDETDCNEMIMLRRVRAALYALYDALTEYFENYERSKTHE